MITSLPLPQKEAGRLNTLVKFQPEFTPIDGQFSAGNNTRAKVVTIEVTRKGRLNLHKFDAALQAQLEGYLVELGILQKGQTLNAQETPPSADATEQQPAFEY